MNLIINHFELRKVETISILWDYSKAIGLRNLNKKGIHKATPTFFRLKFWKAFKNSWILLLHNKLRTNVPTSDISFWDPIWTQRDLVAHVFEWVVRTCFKRAHKVGVIVRQLGYLIGNPFVCWVKPLVLLVRWWS